LGEQLASNQFLRPLYLESSQMKYCEASRAGGADTLTVLIGREAAPLDARRTFVHMSYLYAYGMPARVAMQGYLATRRPSARDDSGLGMAALRRTAAHIARRLHGQIAFPIAPRVAAVIPPNGTPCAGKPIDQAPPDSIHIVATIRTLALGRDRLWLMSGKFGRCHEITLRPTASARYHHIHYAWWQSSYSPGHRPVAITRR
jgi:hypothetical protein